jgi:hypothetical protein
MTDSMPSPYANHTSAKLFLDTELAKTNPDAYTSMHLATIRHPDGFGSYLHIFEVTNHLKADHVPKGVYVIRRINGVWEVVS